MQQVDNDIWLTGANMVVSPHFDERPQTGAGSEISLLVIHNISLPPASCEDDFDNEVVEAFFIGALDCQRYPSLVELAGVRVSSHLYIKRCGKVIQFVPLNKRAWHAGVSCFAGRERCNDFSIGIELQGTDTLPYSDAQYESLISVTLQIRRLYPAIGLDNIVGHCHIAPERKTDPGASFDWVRYKNAI